jgi:hypothetical protein
MLKSSWRLGGLKKMPTEDGISGINKERYKSLLFCRCGHQLCFEPGSVRAAEI